MKPRAELHCTFPIHAVLYLFIATVTGNTEHKVHNIVLYPDKHSWCKTTAIKQVVAYPGCDSVVMDNNVCVGACFSYSIPRTVPSSPGEVLPYCDSCQPSNTTLKHVTLKCSSGEFEGETMNKRVEIITNCSCMTCRDASSRDMLMDDDALDAPDSSDTLLDVPQLFGLMHSSREKFNKTFSTFHSNHTGLVNDSIINERLILLLTELNAGAEEVSAPNQVALKELLTKVEGDNHEVNDATLQDIVKKVQKEEHINIDIERLKQVLIKLENSEKHKAAQSTNGHRHQHMLGPHHSLVLGPNTHHDMIHSGLFLTPTLDVASHHLKPALAGSELSYHDNLVPAETEGEHPTDSEQD